MSLSEVMESTVAELQGREAERSSRQNRDHRNTNWQRGRARAASVRLNAKPKIHPDASSRARWPARKVKALTRGDLDRESGQGVSRGRSSVEAGEQVSRWSEGPKNQCKVRPTTGGVLARKALGTRDVTTTVMPPGQAGEGGTMEMGWARTGRAKSEPPHQRRRKQCTT